MLTIETQEWFTQLAKHNEQQMETAVKEMEAATQKRAEEQRSWSISWKSNKEIKN